MVFKETRHTNDSLTGKPIKNLPKEIRIAPSAPGQDLYNVLAEKSGYSVHRLRVTKGSDKGLVPNVKDTTVDDIGVKDKSVVHVKDLGMLAYTYTFAHGQG